MNTAEATEAAKPETAAARTWRIDLAAPLLVYLLGVVALGDWIIDDAGISFAYARNVAHLDGFVSQPGRAPVEGFSNFAWVLALVPTFWLHLFHPVVTPKVLGVLTVGGAFFLLQRTLARHTGSRWPGIVVTSLLAVSPPIVIWTASGLENGLLLLLVTALFAVVVDRGPRWELHAGVLAALLAMTRPDGIAYVLAGAVASVAVAAPERRATARRYAAAFAVPFGVFFLFRLAKFGRPWPHPYYAKRSYDSGGERLQFFLDHPGAIFEKLGDFAHGLAGRLGVPLVLATVIMLVVLARRKQLRRDIVVAAGLQLLAVGVFVWMDEDWMKEYRFATAAVLLSFVTPVLASHALYGAQRARVIGVWAAGGAIALLELSSRLYQFAANPTTPYADIERHAHRFNRYADALGLAHPSMLTANIGGELVASRLGIYDAAGLTEPAVVHTLKHDVKGWYYEKHPEFYDWVLVTAKPTFVSLDLFWTFVTALERDPRFVHDYVAIDRYPDTYVASTYNANLYSGDYVRRDALGDAANLGRLRDLPRQPPRLDPFLVRLGERFGFVGPPPTASEDNLVTAAVITRAKGDPNRAATLFQYALGAVGDHRPMLQALGETLDRAGRPDEGRLAWLELVTAANAVNDVTAAARALRRLEVQSTPEEAAAMKRGVDALYTAKNADEAIVVFRGMIAVNPNHYGATYQLAVALERAGQPDAARDQWKRVLQMAIVYEDKGSADTARARLGKAAPPPPAAPK